MVNIRASDLPWLEEMKRQDPTAQHTDYRNVTLEELQVLMCCLLSLVFRTSLLSNDQMLAGRRHQHWRCQSRRPLQRVGAARHKHSRNAVRRPQRAATHRPCCGCAAEAARRARRTRQVGGLHGSLGIRRAESAPILQQEGAGPPGASQLCWRVPG